MAKTQSKKWIAGAVSKAGALRRTAKAKKGKPIPAATLSKLAHSKNPTTRKRAILAQTFRKMHAK